MGDCCSPIWDKRCDPCHLVADETDSERDKTEKSGLDHIIMQGDTLYRLKITDRKEGYISTGSLEETKKSYQQQILKTL